MADKGVENKYIINPSFRLRTSHLSVAWHEVDAPTLNAEGVITVQGRMAMKENGNVVVMCEYHAPQLDIIYSPLTEFDTPKVQKWLRELMRDVITDRARKILPDRVRYWENKKGMHGKGVIVKNLRKNVLGCCTGDNEIHLPPFLVIFKQEWMDGVILHEMAHYIHKHHRKPFWDLLSQLLGTDARKADAKTDIALSPYFDYYRYLTS
ncbi:MAG: M48 family metallopeptidase [Duncaniella sp.]|nr:M48 family metallopeptidase [Duncaniella sp.]